MKSYLKPEELPELNAPSRVGRDLVELVLEGGHLTSESLLCAEAHAGQAAAHHAFG